MAELAFGPRAGDELKCGCLIKTGLANGLGHALQMADRCEASLHSYRFFWRTRSPMIFGPRFKWPVSGAASADRCPGKRHCCRSKSPMPAFIAETELQADRVSGRAFPILWITQFFAERAKSSAPFPRRACVSNGHFLVGPRFSFFVWQVSGTESTLSIFPFLDAPTGNKGCRSEISCAVRGFSR